MMRTEKSPDHRVNSDTPHWETRPRFAASFGSHTTLQVLSIHSTRRSRLGQRGGSVSPRDWTSLPMWEAPDAHTKSPSELLKWRSSSPCT